MNLQETRKKHTRYITGIAATSGLASLHKRFNNGISRITGKNLTRAGLIGFGAYGAAKTIDNILYHAAEHQNQKLLQEKKELNSMIDLNKVACYYDNTGLKEFVKVAADQIGVDAYLVPNSLAYDAYTLYNMLPENGAASIVDSMYENVNAGMDKIAMKMVAANVVHRSKTAGVLPAIKSVGSLAGKAVGPALTAGSVVATANEYAAKEKPFYTTKSDNPV